MVSHRGGERPDEGGAGRSDEAAIDADLDADRAADRYADRDADRDADLDADDDADRDRGGDAAAPIPRRESPGRDRIRDRPAPGAGWDPICRVAVWATAAFVVASVLAAAWPDTFMPLSVPVDLALFAGGCIAFLWAYVVAIGRSRYEAVTMGGLFFLSDDVAPPAVTRLLQGILGVQVVVAVAAASVRPFTALAFSVLVPMLGLGLMALWAARHGRFPAKPPDQGD